MERQPGTSPPVTLVRLPQRGVFQLSNEDYFIEPLQGVPAQTGHAQPHVVYKHQVPEQRGQQDNSRAPGTCGVQGMFLPMELWLGMTFRHTSFLEASLNTLVVRFLALEARNIQTDILP